MQVLETNLVQTGKSFLDFKRESNSKTFPEDFTSYIKSKGDIYFWPQGDFHVVTQVGLAKEILDSKAFSADRSSFFISRIPNIDLRLLQDFFGVVSKMMVMSDDKAHLLRKRMAAVGFEDHIIERFKFKLEETIEIACYTN
jgi:cytochrome P450